MEKTFNFNGTPNRQPIVLQTTIVLTWLSWLYYSTLLHNNINIEAFQNPSYTLLLESPFYLLKALK